MAETQAFAPEPWISPPQAVRRDWIDWNGHMNVGYYTLAFDSALDGFLAPLGIHGQAARDERFGPFAVQSQFHYLGELREGDRFRCAFRVLDHDARMLHLWGEMENAATGAAAACMETLLLCVDLEARRAMRFPPHVAGRIAALAAAQAGLPRPERAGAPLGIRRRAG